MIREFNPKSEIKDDAPKPFRIFWRNKITGETGQGEYLGTKTALQWMKAMNEEYPDIEHKLIP